MKHVGYKRRMCLFMPCLFQYSHSFTYFSCLDLAIFGNVIDFHGKVYFFLCGFSRFPDSILFLHKSGKKQEKKIVQSTLASPPSHSFIDICCIRFASAFEKYSLSVLDLKPISSLSFFKTL